MGGRRLTRRGLLTGRHQRAVLPPGMIAERPDICRSCGVCAEHCPTSILLISDHGPHVDFSRGECTFCGECRAHCPAAAELYGPAIGFTHVITIGAECLPHRGVDCQACRDVCPTAAIRFRPRLGGPFLPHLDASACTGCGACMSVCPVDAVSVTHEMEMADA